MSTETPEANLAPRATSSLASLGFEQRTVASFDGTPLAIMTSGPSKAPVLLLGNGLGTTVGAFRFVVERFRGAFRFVGWDYRGLRGSGRPVRGYGALSVADHAKDGHAVLQAVDVDVASAHALGWSMGVQVLLEMQRARSFRSLVLHNGVAGRPWTSLFGGIFRGRMGNVVDTALARSQKLDDHLETAVLRALSWRGFVPLAIRLGFLSDDVDRAVFHDVAAGYRDLDMHVVVEILRRLGEHDAFDVLPKITCPTLIVHGAADRLTPLVIAQEMARAIPDATLVALEGGSHFAAVERPAAMNEALAMFWRAQGIPA